MTAAARTPTSLQYSEELSHKGFVSASCSTYSTFCEVLSELGTTFNVTNVVASDAAGGLLASNRAMPPHTDHPQAKYIAWFCERSAEAGGVTTLVDTRPILSAMGNTDSELLETVRVTVPSMAGTPSYLHPMLTGTHLYFASWLVEQPTDTARRAALAKFWKATREATPVAIEWHPGAALIIDNHRILHGRTSFIDKSVLGRKLVRHWLK